MFSSLISGEPVSPAYSFIPDRPRTVCISGHREKSIIPYSGDPQYRQLTVTAVKLMLNRYIDMAVERGYTTFISGLASGADLWAAQSVMVKKRTHPSLRLICVMPYLRHADHFSQYWKEVLELVEHNSDALLTVNTDPDIVYSRSGAGSSLYRDRNYYMVDQSSAVIAFLNKDSFASGTSQTVNYAYRNGRKICRFGVEDIHGIISQAGPDIEKIKREIVFLPNAFDAVE